jgi:hypothetical protein
MIDRWTCLVTGRAGGHDSYNHHAAHCIHCSPDDELRIHDEDAESKENRMLAVEDDEKGHTARRRNMQLTNASPLAHVQCSSFLSCSCLPAESPTWPWDEWGANDKVLHRMTGLHRPELDWVYKHCREDLLAYRLSMRQRHANMPPLSPHGALCLTLHWLRKYPPTRDMHTRFTHSRHYLYDVIDRVLHIMDERITEQLIKPIAPTAPLSTRSTLPNVRIVVDTTFWPMPRTPFNPKMYHKKSPTKSAFKYQIGIDLSHRIINVTQTYRGPTDDRRILRESGLLDQVKDDARIIGDRGYTGNLGVITPARRGKKRNLELARLEDESTKRHELETERAAVENINSRVKQWHVLDRQWRGEYGEVELMDVIVRVCCALTNLTLDEHPLRKAS